MDDEFVAFWRAYPRKVKKGDAWKAWCQTEKLRPPLDKLIAAIQRAKRSEQWQKDGGQYIPYPATWLRAWGWEDQYEVDLSDPCARDPAHGKGTHMLGDILVCEQCWMREAIRRVK